MTFDERLKQTRLAQRKVPAPKPGPLGEWSYFSNCTIDIKKRSAPDAPTFLLATYCRV